MGCCHIYTNIYRCALTRVYYNITYMCACFLCVLQWFPRWNAQRDSTALTDYAVQGYPMKVKYCLPLGLETAISNSFSPRSQ